MRTAVIGGGLTGMTVAYRRAAAGDEVILFEGSSRLGGQLWTEVADAFVVEHGAEGFIARSESVPALAASLGIAHDLVGQEIERSFGFDGSRLLTLAPGEAAKFLGFQVPRDELGRGIRSCARGMGELVDALAHAIRPLADVRTGTRVDAIAPGESGGHRWRVMTGAGAFAVDAVVVAVPSGAAANLLEATFGAAGAGLRVGRVLASCTVSLAYPKRAVPHALDGTGFVVAEAHQVEGFRACTFTTSKFAERAPEGWASLRLFFRPTDGDLAMDNAHWTARAKRAVERVLGVRDAPARAWVSRWPRALPVFDPTFKAAVAALEQALAGRGVLLAGAAFHGPGIDAAVRSAEAASRALE
jgi:oxygen-dependent protoporphyrinogen oxidase